MKKMYQWIVVVSGLVFGAQASIVSDHLVAELNADDITTVAGGSVWSARSGASAVLNDTVAKDLAKRTATVNGGRTSPLVAGMLTKGVNTSSVNLGATRPALQGTSMTVELWLSPIFSCIPFNSQTIFETGGAARGMSVTLGDNGSGKKNTLRFAMKDDSSSAFVDVALPSSFSDGDLHQLVVSYDNLNTLSFYVDGALKGRNSNAGSINWDGMSGAGFWGFDGNLGAAGVGLDSTGNGNGSIAVFRQYNDVLTEAEVLQNYHATVSAASVEKRVGARYKRAAAPVYSPDAPRPNILILLSDDLPWKMVGYNGETMIETPNIDQIAVNGVRLTSFYAQSVCTPTRAALMTGRYPFRTGSMGRFSGTGGMLADERTLANAMQEAGYWTAIVGKWHLGDWEQEYLPRQRGFDHQYGLYGGVIDYYDHARKFGDARGTIYDWHRNDEPLKEEGHTTDLIRDEAVRLIRNHSGEKPFFMYVPFTAPHSPHGLSQVQKELVDYYRKKGCNYSEFAPLIHTMDEAIGDIVQAVDDRGWLDNTLIVFFNDNGGHVGKDPNDPYRGPKATYLEGGIRVPFAAQWPGRIKPNTVSDEPVMVNDLYPTLIKLAGGSLEQPLPIDGLDIWPVMAKGAKTPRKEFIWSPKVIRHGDWKLIDTDGQYYPGSMLLKRLPENEIVREAQLYNIKADPYETKNRINEMPELVEQLRKRLATVADEIRTPAPAKGAIPKWAKIYGEEEAKAFEGF